MNKKEMLSKATSNNFGLDLYLDNKTISNEPKKEEPKKEVKEEVKIVETPKKEVVKKEKIETPKKEVIKKEEPKKEETEKELSRMISFRFPESIIEKLNNYSYVARENKTDVVINALEKIFNSKEGKEILSEYDRIKRK